MRHGVGRTPPLFVNQLVHVILRNVLDGCEDAFMLRAAELFFRPQRLTIHEGSLIAADEETVAGASRQAVVAAGVDARLAGAEPTSTCSTTTTPARYWERSDQFDMALDLTPAGAGSRRSATVIARWVEHLLVGRGRGRAAGRGARTSISPGMSASMPRRPRSAMRCGTARSSRRGARDRIVGLFRLTFRDPDVVLDKARGEPIYLMLAMTPDALLRMKPQNLLTGLPIRHLEAVS